MLLHLYDSVVNLIKRRYLMHPYLSFIRCFPSSTNCFWCCADYFPLPLTYFAPLVDIFFFTMVHVFQRHIIHNLGGVLLWSLVLWMWLLQLWRCDKWHHSISYILFTYQNIFLFRIWSWFNSWLFVLLLRSDFKSYFLSHLKTLSVYNTTV